MGVGPVEMAFLVGKSSILMLVLMRRVSMWEDRQAVERGYGKLVEDDCPSTSSCICAPKLLRICCYRGGVSCRLGRLECAGLTFSTKGIQR